MITKIKLDANFTKILAPTVCSIEKEAKLFFGAVKQFEIKSAVYIADILWKNEQLRVFNIRQLRCDMPETRSHNGICPSHVFIQNGKTVLQTASFLNETSHPYKIQSDQFIWNQSLQDFYFDRPLRFTTGYVPLFECGASYDTNSQKQYFVLGNKFVFDECREKAVPLYALFKRSQNVHSIGKITPVLKSCFYQKYHGVSRVSFNSGFGYFSARKINKFQVDPVDVYRFKLGVDTPQSPERMERLQNLIFPNVSVVNGKKICLGSLGNMGDGGMGYVQF